MDLTDEQWKVLEPLIGALPQAGRWSGTAQEPQPGGVAAASSGFCEPESNGQICPIGIHRTRRATAGSNAGCMRKHNWHTDSHQGLVRKLTSLGEASIATHWATLERLRTSGWYTYQATSIQVAEARNAWQVIRTWATT